MSSATSEIFLLPFWLNLVSRIFSKSKSRWRSKLKRNATVNFKWRQIVPSWSPEIHFRTMRFNNNQSNHDYDSSMVRNDHLALTRREGATGKRASNLNHTLSNSQKLFYHQIKTISHSRKFQCKSFLKSVV